MTTVLREPVAWRDRHAKKNPAARCCWVCGLLGGDGFTAALRFAGYRMPVGTVAHAHARYVARAQREHREHVEKRR
jgi:hypothetical protein